jgi:phage gp16-like protein
MNNTIDIHSRNTPTIHQMRRAGWKVRVIHGKMETPLSDRFTRIELTSPEGKDSTGTAYCSKVDQWNRKLGNRIALGRALKNYSTVN